MATRNSTGASRAKRTRKLSEAEWKAREKAVGVATGNADAAAALQEAAATIRQMPGSAAAFRDALIVGTERVFERMIRPGLQGDGDCVNALFAKCVPGGFRYSDDAMQEIDELWAEMMNVLRSATVHFDRAARTSAVTEVHAIAANANPAFRGFLKKLTPTD